MGQATAAMHLITGLLRRGYRAGAIDLTARQATPSGRLSARAAFAEAKGLSLPQPVFSAVPRASHDSRAEAQADEAARFSASR